MAAKTVYATPSDGQIISDSDVSYAAAHDATTGTAGAIGIDNVHRNRTTPTGWRVNRGFWYFEPGLLIGDIVTAVAIWLYCEANAEANAGHSDLCLFEGTQGDPLVNDDFNNFLTTLLTAGTYSFEHPMITNGYTSATLNAAGIALVHAGRTGTVKFCTRLLGDVSTLTPNGSNYVTIYTNEKGAGYLPKLDITYTPAPLIPRSQAYILG